MKHKGLLHCAWLLLALTWMVASCKPSVPSEFISEGDMEDILYDYQVADAMAHLDNDHYASTLVAYRTAVLRKYGVTQAEFDTSMVYYMRHTDRLLAIYKRIGERLEDKARDLGSSEGALASIMGASASGDTADIWKADRSMALIPNQPYNHYSFAYQADSAFHRGDTFILAFHSDFIFQDGVREGIAVLSVVFANDSVASQVQHVSSSMPTQLRVEDRDTLGIKEVKGYFLLNRSAWDNSSSTTLQLMSVSNIHLYRCRRPKALPGATNPADQQPGDSMPARPRRMTMGQEVPLRGDTARPLPLPKN